MTAFIRDESEEVMVHRAGVTSLYEENLQALNNLIGDNEGRRNDPLIAPLVKFSDRQFRDNGQPLLQDYFNANNTPINQRANFIRSISHLSNNQSFNRAVGEAMLAQLGQGNANQALIQSIMQWNSQNQNQSMARIIQNALDLPD